MANSWTEESSIKSSLQQQKQQSRDRATVVRSGATSARCYLYSSRYDLIVAAEEDNSTQERQGVVIGAAIYGLRLDEQNFQEKGSRLPRTSKEQREYLHVHLFGATRVATELELLYCYSACTSSQNGSLRGRSRFEGLGGNRRKKNRGKEIIFEFYHAWCRPVLSLSSWCRSIANCDIGINNTK